MAKKRLVEHNALVQAIEFGTPKEEVMHRFGYKSLGALKVAYLNGLVALGRAPALETKRKEKKVDNKVKVNNRGSLVIPKALVDSLGLDRSDVFRVEKSEKGLSLTVAPKPPKTILKKKNGSTQG